MFKLLYFIFENTNILFSVSKELVVPSHKYLGDASEGRCFQSKHIADFVAQMQRNAEVGAAFMQCYCFLLD